MIGTTISHYKILEKLGSGGMGDVYKAEDTKLQRIVALKFLPPELTRDERAQKRFVHEARTASALDHPNIGTIYEIGESDGNFFIAMAYYEGATLKDKIESGKDGLDIAEAVDITIRITRGLAAAHKKDIIHRDIKPANILMTGAGEVKLIDFGLAKLKDHTMLTKTGTTMGTIAYMSPEQFTGGVVDHRSDIWSLGVLLYEMLTGEQPFKGDYEQAIVYSILNEQPEFITKIRKDVPVQIERILEKAMARNPAKRFQSMEEMLNELNNAAGEIRQGQSKKSSPFKLGRRQRKIAFRALAVVFIAIPSGLYFWQSKVAEAGPVSIVMMPLDSFTEDSQQDWFTESLTDALITDLGKISKLRVISLASAMQMKGTNKPPPEIAIELGVDYVIEGSVIRMGNQVKIRVRLINAKENEYLWTETYEREFTDILAMQGNIVQSIASEVQVNLTPQEADRIAVSRKVDPETHELYLKGMYHLRKYTPEGIATGLKYLQEAVEKDPEEPLALGGLALGYSIIAHTPSPPPDALSKSREIGRKALELDESQGETHLAVAMAQIYGDWDRKGAEKSYKRALELNPSLAEAYNQYAWYLLLAGKDNEAVESLKQAQEVDPLTPAYPAWLGMLYFWLERYDEAKEEAMKSLELMPDFPIALMTIGSVYAVDGMFEEAIAVHRKLGAMSLDWKWCLGQSYALAGRRDDALAVVAELESQAKVWYTWGLAEVYTALGDKYLAFYWLNEAYKQHHPYIQWIWRNPSFKPLREDPRFWDLSRRLNLMTGSTACNRLNEVLVSDRCDYLYFR
jgi:serine/threonine protein kinase